MMEKSEERDRRLASCGLSTRSRIGWMSSAVKRLGGADDGHQNDGEEEMRNVGAGVAEQAGQFFHRRAFSRDRSR